MVSARSDQVVTLTRGGTTVSYFDGVRGRRRRAEIVEMSGPDVLDVLHSEFSGWVVVVPVEWGTALCEGGARFVRHAHAMHRDLLGDPPPAEWSRLAPAAGLRVVPADRDARDVLPAWRAAFPAGHVDWFDGTDEEALVTRMRPLLAGEVLGPVLPSSAMVVDELDRVVAACVVCDHPHGTPWVGDVFRRPEPEFAGLGALLLRRALAALASDGVPLVGLAVTEGNPARAIYERLRFRAVASTMTVRLN